MDLENATLVELRQLAKEQGIKNVSKLKKEELLEILEVSKEYELNTEKISKEKRGDFSSFLHYFPISI